MKKPVVISVALIHLRGSSERTCAECLRPISVRALRICEKDEHGIAVYYYHPEVDREDEIRGCSPDTERVRKVLRPVKVSA